MQAPYQISFLAATIVCFTKIKTTTHTLLRRGPHAENIKKSSKNIRFFAQVALCPCHDSTYAVAQWSQQLMERGLDLSLKTDNRR